MYRDKITCEWKIGMEVEVTGRDFFWEWWFWSLNQKPSVHLLIWWFAFLDKFPEYADLPKISFRLFCCSFSIKANICDAVVLISFRKVNLIKKKWMFWHFLCFGTIDGFGFLNFLPKVPWFSLIRKRVLYALMWFFIIV